MYIYIRLIPCSFFVQILDAYLWHYEQGNALITRNYIASLVQLIDQVRRIPIRRRRIIRIQLVLLTLDTY